MYLQWPIGRSGYGPGGDWADGGSVIAGTAGRWPRARAGCWRSSPRNVGGSTPRTPRLGRRARGWQLLAGVLHRAQGRRHADRPRL